MPGGREPVNVADLGHEDRRERGTDTLDLLYGPISPVVLQLAVDRPLDDSQFPLEELQQVPQ